jgi:hypothetical protein
MVNAELRTLHAADGTPVCNVSFDLSTEQALRELTGVSDELHRLAEPGAHATVVLPLARFAALHDALTEWVAHHDQLGWMREDDAAIYPMIAALTDPMASLREDALHAVLGAGAHAHEHDA